jgi:hypothetical protein
LLLLPPGFKRIRHYGLLSPALKAGSLAAARQALAMPAANAQARENAAAFLKRVAGIANCRGAAVIRSALIFSTIACRPRHGNGSAHACGLARRLVDHRGHRRCRDNRRRTRPGQPRHAANAIRSHCGVAQSGC